MVYDMRARQHLRTLDSKNTPVQMRDAIYVMETSPTQEDVVLTADYSGNIIVWDVAAGVVLTWFVERGFALGYPNT